MITGPLANTLRRLSAESDALMAPELAGLVALDSLRPAVIELSDRLTALRPALIGAPGDDRPELDYLWQQVEMRLAYMLPPQIDRDSADLDQLIPWISAQVLQFAKQSIEQSLNAAELEEVDALALRVNELRAQINDSTDPNQADWQRLLHEARLELDFVLNGNKGAVSLRLGHYIRDRE